MNIVRLEKTRGGNMVKKSLYDKYVEDPEFERLMVQEDLIMDVSEDFCKLLKEKKMKRSDLANVMGKTKGLISQFLNGSRNMTLRSIADIAYHLGYKVKITFQAKKVKKRYNIINVDWRHNSSKQLPMDKIHMADGYVDFDDKISRIAP